jgi:nucleotide-binding universal stress UspA family protein
VDADAFFRPLKENNMIKTIVVHVDGSPQQESRLRAAALLANEHGAHLVGSAVTGTSWRAYAILAGSMGAQMIEDDFEDMRHAARMRLDEFMAQAGRLGVESFEGRLIEDEATYALLLQSRYADLIVVSQDCESDVVPPTQVRSLPEHLALRGARPVLVVPDNYHGQPLSGSVVVGWDGSMQAIRAIGAALPLLKRAGSVKLALVNPEDLVELHGDEPGADMALYLARHDIAVEVVVERTSAEAGEALLTLARDTGAGLIVAGAYGHSRVREWALGGVTRDLLDCASIPVLLAH